VRAWFCEKCDDHKKVTRSRVSISFSCNILKIQNTGHSIRISPWEIVRAWFREKT
ncbi:hypothetical protein B296_00053709, partial [Ensete ventricosum]